MVVLSRYNDYLLSLWYDIYLCEDDLDEQSIFDKRQEIKLIVVNMM